MKEIGAAIADAATGGACRPDVYIQYGAAHGAFFDDGRLESIASSRRDGLGVRVVRGDDTTFASSRGATAASLSSALEEVSALSGVRIASPTRRSDDEIADVRVCASSLDTSVFHDLDKMVRAECSYVKQASFGYTTSVRAVFIVRSDGSIVRDDRAYTNFSVSIVLERDGSLETGHEQRCMSTTADVFWTHGESATAEEIARTALRRGIAQLEARQCPAGKMPVILDGSAGGTMIHEACGHGMEADIVYKDHSVFEGKIGTQIASPIVTIIDDASLPGRYGSYRFDDEGTPAARTVLVRDGVLESWLTDITTAELYDLPLTGNGRRESFGCIPMPRMSNTFVAPGTTSLEEMISDAGDGLLVRKMGGGEVDPTTGAFVFYVSEGNLIRGGKICEAVKGATLTGSGPEALKKIRAVGRELKLDPGVCGKSGQSVPVTDGQPSLLIEEMIVGGRDADHGE